MRYLFRMNLTKSIFTLSLLVFTLSVVLACSKDAAVNISPKSSKEASGGSPKALKVVTTVSPITSLVENIGGTKIILEGIVPEGTNSHTFEPAPSTASLMAEADLIVLNGLFLEEPSLQMAKANSLKLINKFCSLFIDIASQVLASRDHDHLNRILLARCNLWQIEFLGVGIKGKKFAQEVERRKLKGKTGRPQAEYEDDEK